MMKKKSQNREMLHSRPGRGLRAALFMLLLLGMSFFQGQNEIRAAACAPKPLKLSIFPFSVTAGTVPYKGEDLAGMLEAALSSNEMFQIIGLEAVSQSRWDLDPLMARGDFSDSTTDRSGRAYFQFQQKVIKTLKVGESADYFIQGQLLPVKEGWLIRSTLFKTTAPATPVFASGHPTETAEQIPGALKAAAQAIEAFFKPGWSLDCLHDIQADYMGGLLSLSAAIEQVQGLMDEGETGLSGDAFLLRFYLDDVQTYGEALLGTAKKLVAEMDPADQKLKQTFSLLAVNPFTILCQAQAEAADWNGVLETCRLGMLKYPLYAGDYETWHRQAQIRLHEDR